MKKLSDLDKTLRVRHLQGKTIKKIVEHVGIKREKKKSEVLIMTGGDLPDEYEETVFLYWNGMGSKFPLVLNATNREFIIKVIGDTEDWAKKLTGKELTLERQVHPAFKKEYVGITAITDPKTKETVDTKTGEIKTTANDPAALFWNRANELKMNPEASEVLQRNTDKTGAVVVIHWGEALAELNAIARPA